MVWFWDLELEFGIVAPRGPGAIAAIAVISMLRFVQVLSRAEMRGVRD